MAEKTPPTDVQRAAARREFYRRHFIEFAAEQLKVRDIGGGPLRPFTLTEGQRIFYDRIQEQIAVQGFVRAILLKSRQFGGSTETQAFAFHQSVFNENFSSLLVAADQKSTAAVFRIAQLFYERIDEDLRPMILWLNKEELHFANPDKHTRHRVPGLNSRLEFQTAKNALAGTGTTRNFLHLTEVAKWDESLIDDLVSSLLPAIHPRPNTWIVMESTAFEGGEYFRDMCDDGQKAEMARFKAQSYLGSDFPYVFIFVPWWIDSKNSEALLKGQELKLTPDERGLQKYANGGFQKQYPHLRIPLHEITPEQIKYRRTRIAQMGEDTWAQEYPDNPSEAWISRDRYVFDRNALHQAKKDVRPPREFIDIEPGPVVKTRHREGNVFADREYIAIWKHPEPGHTYDIGIDVAMGTDDGNWSTGEVLDRATREQVAEYHKRIEPIDFAAELFWFGKYYHIAQLVVEMNGPGIVVGHHLEKMNYPYIYTWRNIERYGMPMGSLMGWQTTAKTKEILVSTARHNVNHGETAIHSRVLWDEMWWFVEIDQGVYRAARGWDDCVMGYMIGTIGGVHEGHVDTTPVTPKDDRPLQSPATCDDFDPTERRSATRVGNEVRELKGMR